MPNLTSPDDLLYTADVAEMKRVDVRTVHRWVRTGRLKPAVEPRGAKAAFIFRRADVDALEDERAAS